jgi:hypothetical protein
MFTTGLAAHKIKVKIWGLRRRLRQGGVVAERVKERPGETDFLKGAARERW